MLPHNRFEISRLRHDLRPFRLHFFPTLRSTNLHAAALRRKKKLFAPAIVLTSRQTAGRGRGNNKWFSGGGSLTVTFVLPVDAHQPHELPLIGGLAARTACAELTGCEDVLVKWPNDLLVNGKKLAGLLCERVEKADLVGIGINVNTRLSLAPAKLRGQITSLEQLTGRKLDMNEVLIALARHVRLTVRRRDEMPFAPLLDEFRQYDALAGKSLRVVGENGEQDISGIGEGIDSSGRLLVRHGNKLHRVIAGHVLMTE